MNYKKLYYAIEKNVKFDVAKYIESERARKEKYKNHPDYHFVEGHDGWIAYHKNGKRYAEIKKAEAQAEYAKFDAEQWLELAIDAACENDEITKAELRIILQKYTDFTIEKFNTLIEAVEAEIDVI